MIIRIEFNTDDDIENDDRYTVSQVDGPAPGSVIQLKSGLQNPVKSKNIRIEKFNPT